MDKKQERNESEKIPFKLKRETPSHVYRVLVCECGAMESLRIALADNGQWDVTCTTCYEAACLIGEIINELG